MTTPNTSAVRAWARENGYDVADRGRLRPELLDAYADAHRKSGSTAKKAPAAKPAARKATAAKPAVKKVAAAPAPTPAHEPEVATEPESPEPKPKPVADDRRLVALGEEVAALTERVAQLEAQVGTKNGKSSSKTARFRRSK